MNTPDLIEHPTTCAPNHVIVPSLVGVSQRYPAADPFVVHYSSAWPRVNVAALLDVLQSEPRKRAVCEYR